MKSKYRMGWLIVCFDLLVVEKEQIFITDKQWGQSICIEKNNYLKSKYKKKTGEHKEQQMTFW